MRDLTRGGLATALVEIAQTSGVSINITELEIPVREDVKGACEILGLDPLYVANEGQFVVFVKAEHAKQALEIIQTDPLGSQTRIIGNVLLLLPAIVFDAGLVRINKNRNCGETLHEVWAKCIVDYAVQKRRGGRKRASRSRRAPDRGRHRRPRALRLDR